MTLYIVEIRDYESGDGDYPEADARYIANTLNDDINRRGSDGVVIVHIAPPTPPTCVECPSCGSEVVTREAKAL